MTVEGRRRLGHYLILSRIGAGGMGQVFLAEDEKLGRQVALKVLSPELAGDSAHLARFQREARALAALNHPGIVTVYSVEEDAGEHFFTMELVTGRTLADRIRPAGMQLDALLALAIPLAEALDAAHRQGITHRDLKPSNIMVTDDGRVKVLDFGLAKLAQPEPGSANLAASGLPLTESGMILGSFPYMSPEQVSAKSADHRSDIFALGVILYEMATGRRPFAGDSVAALLNAILQEQPSAVILRNPSLPPALDRLISRCLEKDPARRPQSTDEVVRELRMLAGAGGREGEASRAHVPSIVVLPFANMSADPEQEYFCDGMAEEIINALANVTGLRVVARTSAFTFKGKGEDVREIGRRLGVESVLEGSVRRAGSRVRITVQLVSVVDGFHIWSERFDRELADVFAVQDEIALATVERLKVRLLKNEREELLRRRTENQEAYHLFLKGRFFFNRRREGDIARALEVYREAIAIDPGYILPYVDIAATFCVLGLWSLLPPAEAFSQARAAADKALAIDEGFADAHFAKAFVLFLHDRNHEGAEYHFRRGLEAKAPGSGIPLAYGPYLLERGRVDEAIELARQIAAAEPLSPIALTQAAAGYLGAGLVEEAQACLRAALELDPSMPIAQIWLGWSLGVQGRDREALAPLRAAAESGPTIALGLLGLLLGRLGERDEAERVLARLEELGTRRYVPFSVFSLVHAGLGDSQKAASFFAKASEAGEPFTFLSTFGRWAEGMMAGAWTAEVRGGRGAGVRSP